MGHRASDSICARLGGLSDRSTAVLKSVMNRKMVIPLVVALLQTLPEGFRGDFTIEDSSTLRGTVRSLRITRGDFVGPCFQVDAATFIADPVIARIRRKFRKRYDTPNRLELLAFYDLHPTQRAGFRLPAVETFVRENLGSSQFSRVWIFDTANRAVLYCSP
jgi:hypothetical protein